MKSFNRYLIPSIITSLIFSCYSIIDGIFIGQKLGDIGLAAINIAWPITGFIQCIGTGIGLSVGILISFYMGKGEKEKADKLKLTGVIILAITGLIVGLIVLAFAKPILTLFGASDSLLELSYEYIKIILLGSIFQMLGVGLVPLLKNSGKTIVALVASIISTFVNFILDYILVFIYDYGLFGAAIASVIGQVSAFVICFIFYFKEFRGIAFTKYNLLKIFKGMLAPTMLNYSYSISIIITNAVILLVSNYEADSAYTLLSYLLYVIQAISLGVGDAIQPLFSYHYARCEYSIIKKYLNKCYIIAFILIILANIILYFIRYYLIDLYSLGDNAILYFNNALLPYLLGFLFVPFIKVSSSYLYSIDKKILSNIIVIFEPVVITLIVYLSLCPIFKLNGVWYSYLVIEIITFIMAIIFVVKTNRSFNKSVV